MDYTKFYNLEDYLLGEVNKNFNGNGFLNAFDFFCIVIWKANRAKSKIAKKLKAKFPNKSLDEIVEILTKEIHKAKEQKEKLRTLLEDWNFGLPMASAILTVLYPKDFTVYDFRVCSVLKKRFENLKNKPKSVLDDYFEYVKAVKLGVTDEMNLRDKDKFLWGKSFYDELKNHIREEFEKQKK